MKNYKFLVPILLVLFFVGSVYMLYSAKAEEVNQYNAMLEDAREYRKQDIQVDAEDCYFQALSLQDTLELSLEIGEFYRETNQLLKAIEWGESITDTYPEEPKAYEYLMGLYDQRQDYVACYDLAETFMKRQLKSEVIDEVLSRIEYTFYFKGDYDDAGIYSYDMSPVLRKGKWGYVDLTGGNVVEAAFSYAGPFIEELAPVTDLEGNSYFIDTAGNKKHVVLGVEKIEKLGLIEEGLFSLYDGNEWSFYNTEHQKVFGGYDDVSAIGNGIAAVKQNGAWSLVDRIGTDLTGKTYQSVAMDEKLVVYRNDRLFVSDGNGYQMIDEAGQIIGNDRYEDVRIFNDTTYAAVKMNGKWGFIDNEGNIVITPQFEDARSFNNGFAAVMQEGLWGFIDMEGNLVINLQFENARDFNSNGCVFVGIDGKWQLLRLYKSNH